MLAAENYVFSEDAEQAFREYIVRRMRRPRFAHAGACATGSSARGSGTPTGCTRRCGRVPSRPSTMLRRIEAQDILKSSVFDEDRREPSAGAASGVTAAASQRRTARPVILGVVGDSAAGKTTITRGLVRVLGEEHVAHICTDDYHRYDRRQRAELGITPLHPDCNYIDIIAQHLAHLRRGEAILKPVYRHKDGTFGPPVYVAPERFTVIEGLLGYHLPEMRDVYDVRVFLNPPEELRRRWKVQRDCSRRGYTTDEVLAELDRREADSEAFIRPQRRYADMLVSFRPSEGEPPAISGSDSPRSRADPVRRAAAPRPVAVINGKPDGLTLVERDGEPSAADSRPDGSGSRGGDRGDALGADALRLPPARAAPRRVHDRHRSAPLGVARARAAADPLPPGHGQGGGRARWRGHADVVRGRGVGVVTPELRGQVPTRGPTEHERPVLRAAAE